MLQKIRNISCLLLIVGASVGCAGILNTEPFVDIYTDENGRKLIADTPRMWQDFTELTHRRIDRELNNMMPPGVDTWNEHWVSTIEVTKEGTQNPNKYINYIIRERQKSGLPELVIQKN